MKSAFNIGYSGTGSLLAQKNRYTKQPSVKPEFKEINRSMRGSVSDQIALEQRLSLRISGIPEFIQVVTRNPELLSPQDNVNISHSHSTLSMITLPDEINDAESKVQCQKNQESGAVARSALFKSPSLISFISNGSVNESETHNEVESDFDILDYI